MNPIDRLELLLHRHQQAIDDAIFFFCLLVCSVGFMLLIGIVYGLFEK